MEQEVAHHPNIEPPQIVERMGQGEDHMIVAHWQMLGATGAQPRPPLATGTSGAKAVATTVVEDAGDVPVRTGLDVPPQRRRMAQVPPAAWHAARGREGAWSARRPDSTRSEGRSAGWPEVP